MAGRTVSECVCVCVCVAYVHVVSVLCLYTCIYV